MPVCKRNLRGHAESAPSDRRPGGGTLWWLPPFGRRGVETAAFYWLVCKESSAASLYDAQESPRPVEIRKRLEALGIDVSDLRDQYGYVSAVSHVGNRYDNLQITWEQERTGKLLIGGGGDASIRRAMLNELPRYIALFAMHDDDYVVTIGEGKASIREGSESSGLEL